MFDWVLNIPLSFCAVTDICIIAPNVIFVQSKLVLNI